MKSRSAYLQALQYDNSLPIEKAAVELWLKDLDNPFRWTLRPLFQLVFAILLHITWFLKRLPLPQFSAHGLLQRIICFFCRNFVSPEANRLILRHYATESNILNFLAENTANKPDSFTNYISLYPKNIDDMKQDSFVKHDQELFRLFAELGYWEQPASPSNTQDLHWEHWQTVNMEAIEVKKKWSQVFDFESAHALFMCLFCLLLKRDEYRDAINGFNLDQSIAIRIGEIIGNSSLVEMAYNKYPLYLVGPWNLGQRFLMHGFFTEFLYGHLEKMRNSNESVRENN